MIFYQMRFGGPDLCLEKRPASSKHALARKSTPLQGSILAGPGSCLKSLNLNYFQGMTD